MADAKFTIADFAAEMAKLTIPAKRTNVVENFRMQRAEAKRLRDAGMPDPMAEFWNQPAKTDE